MTLQYQKKKKKGNWVVAGYCTATLIKTLFTILNVAKVPIAN